MFLFFTKRKGEWVEHGAAPRPAAFPSPSLPVPPVSCRVAVP